MKRYEISHAFWSAVHTIGDVLICLPLLLMALLIGKDGKRKR